MAFCVDRFHTVETTEVVADFETTAVVVEVAVVDVAGAVDSRLGQEFHMGAMVVC